MTGSAWKSILRWQCLNEAASLISECAAGSPTPDKTALNCHDIAIAIQWQL